MKKYVAKRYVGRHFHNWVGLGTVEGKNIKEAAINVFQFEEKLGISCRSIILTDQKGKEYKISRKENVLINAKTGRKIGFLEGKLG